MPMTRWMANVAAGAALAALLALPPALARAAPAFAAPQSAPDAVAPVPPTPNRKPHSGSHAGAGDNNVMRGSDTPGLVAMLPWWRPPDTDGSDPGELESPILTACDVWLGFPFATADAQSLTVRLSAAQNASEIDLVADKIRVADPGELNEIDMTAPAEPQDGGRPWLRGLLAILGGVLAVFSAVRYLVA
ncbi:MAG TPA: hypothetical protein VG291_14820 [Xanthobacteraceae bacterium]|nr:hypothetical protein [Xanthobacteraceae bacterium]